jgi:hypothetical protein
LALGLSLVLLGLLISSLGLPGRRDLALGLWVRLDVRPALVLRPTIDCRFAVGGGSRSTVGLDRRRAEAGLIAIATAIVAQFVIGQALLMHLRALSVQRRLGSLTCGLVLGDPSASVGDVGAASTGLGELAMLGRRPRPALLELPLASALQATAPDSRHRDREQQHDRCDNYDDGHNGTSRHLFSSSFSGASALPLIGQASALVFLDYPGSTLPSLSKRMFEVPFASGGVG